MDFKPYEDKVIHCTTEHETMTLVKMLEEAGFEYAIPFAPLKEMAKGFAVDNGWDGCWRICETRGIAYNRSVKHWLDCGYDVIEFLSMKMQ